MKSVERVRFATAIYALLLAAPFISSASAAATKGESSNSSAKTIRTLDGRQLSEDQIDKTVASLMQANHVTGLGISLLHDGDVVYHKTYGLRDVAAELPLRTDTVMDGASLTKATFAYYVMQLADEGRIELDRPIALYLSRPLPEYARYADLTGDARWTKITPRMLLSHTAGFGNLRWLEPDEKLRLHWEPGSRYGYSGEGMMLLQFVLEEGLKLDTDEEMQQRIFNRFGMTRTSMTWREDFAANCAHGYTMAGQLQSIDHADNVSAAGSMDTTLKDWTRFLVAVARGEGLSSRARAEMVRSVIEIHSVVQFPTLSTETTRANRSIKLGYGMGWGVFESPFGHAFFKEGHDDGTANYALCIDRAKSCILLMSNSVRAEGIFKALVDELFGPTNLPWAWEGYRPFDMKSE